MQLKVLVYTAHLKQRCEQQQIDPSAILTEEFYCDIPENSKMTTEEFKMYVDYLKLMKESTQADPSLKKTMEKTDKVMAKHQKLSKLS